MSHASTLRPPCERVDDDEPASQDGLATFEVITPIAVIDDQGRPWRRMPKAWSACAELCSSGRVCRYPGGEVLLECWRQSEWTDNERGLCGIHFAALLDFAGKGDKP